MKKPKQHQLQLMDLAEAQLLGFFHAKQGYDLQSLVNAMGLSRDEWVYMYDNYDLKMIPDEAKAEITEIVNQ